MVKKTREDILQTLNPFAVPTDDELMIIAQPVARDIVRRYLVDTKMVSPSDADWYENGCLIAAWRCSPKYDPEHVSKRTGRPCTFMSFMKFVMKAFAGDVAAEKLRREKILTILSLDADAELLSRLESEALDAMARTPDQERLERRLDIEAVADSMPGRYREIARLVYLEGLSWPEAAKALGMSRSSVYQDYMPVVVRRMTKGLSEGAD